MSLDPRGTGTRISRGTAVLYAARYPERIGRLILVAPSPRPVGLEITDADRRQVAEEASQQNEDAAAVYYSAGAVDQEATKSALTRLHATVLLIAGEYDVALPPTCAAEYAVLFPQAELAVQEQQAG
ncbi:MAG: alpha/beta fold hydrolase [Nocardioidaceae bacterium]